MKIRYTLFVLVIHVAVLQGIYYFPRLPATVASHFNAAGCPDHWLAKPVFLILRLGLTVATALFFVVLPLWLAKLPAAWIRLPRRDYWLAPPRREQTFLMIRERLTELGTATLITMIVVFQLVIRANLTVSHHFSASIFHAVMIAYGLVVMAWLLRFYQSFARTVCPQAIAEGGDC